MAGDGYQKLDRGQENRELRAVYRDYGQWEQIAWLVHPVDLPGLNNAFHVTHPNHLVKIATDLSRCSRLRPVDVSQGEPAVGWTTGVTTVLIRLKDLRESIVRYSKGSDGQQLRVVRPELLERANVIASRDFRERFSTGWPAMKERYPFITAPEIIG